MTKRFTLQRTWDTSGTEGLRRQFATHRSYWVQQRPAVQRFPAIDEDVRTDVLIMGSGITGLSIALRLLQDGLRVVICESNLLAGEQPPQHRAPGRSSRIRGEFWLKRLGTDRARDLTRLRQHAIDLIESRCDEACHFKRIPAYNFTESEQRASYIATEADAATRCGLDAELTYEVPFPKPIVAIGLAKWDG